MAKPSDRNATLPGMSRAVPTVLEGHYSGDKPNPNLRAVVEARLKERPYLPDKDVYEVPPFDRPIETTKATAIYNMHTYWSKKPHEAIRQYIRHYTKEGDSVLDPFCGSGGTALAALMDGRRAIAIDLSPAATFITRNYCTPIDPEELIAAFGTLKREVEREIAWLYETRCDRCDGKATTAYTVYSQVFQCSRCLEQVALFDCEEVDGETAAGKSKKVRVCPACHKRGHDEEIRTRDEKFGIVPVLVSYLCEGRCRPARGERRHNDNSRKRREYFEKYDLEKLREIETRDIPYWYPPAEMIRGYETTVKRRLDLQGIHRVADLYTSRNLWALALVRSALSRVTSRARDPLTFAFTSILLKASRMMAHNNDGIGRIQKGTYYIPQVIHDVHVLAFLDEAVGDMARGYGQMEHTDVPLVSTDSATRLELPSNAIDYIFTDPPYGGSVQYGELNYVWEAWLGLNTTWHSAEIVINEVRNKTEADWAAGMRAAMAECYRVLKPGRAISLCYHDTSEGTWELVQDIMAECGFVVEKTNAALFIEAKTKTTNQYFSDKVNKRDLVINFRKPKRDQTAGRASERFAAIDSRPFRQAAHMIIRDFLSLHAGSTKDRIYDDLVSKLVQAGEMQAHNFDEVLREVAEEAREPRMRDLFSPVEPDLFGHHEVSRWYLKEGEDAIQDAAESAKEDAAAKSVGSFMAVKLKKEPDKVGVHYSDIFEHFIYAVSEKPRRSLADWLPDYFFKTDEGTWRPPANTQEDALKAQARLDGTSRRLRRFAMLLQDGHAVPPTLMPSAATLAAWIRHSKRTGLYELGRLLYEKSGLDVRGMSEEAQAGIEEDYETCVRALARREGVPETKTRKRRLRDDRRGAGRSAARR